MQILNTSILNWRCFWKLILFQYICYYRFAILPPQKKKKKKKKKKEEEKKPATKHTKKKEKQNNNKKNKKKQTTTTTTKNPNALDTTLKSVMDMKTHFHHIRLC